MFPCMGCGWAAEEKCMTLVVLPHWVVRTFLVGVMLPITFQTALCMDCVEGTGRPYIYP